jgi:hypothetical protein
LFYRGEENLGSSFSLSFPIFVAIQVGGRSCLVLLSWFSLLLDTCSKHAPLPSFVKYVLTPCLWKWELTLNVLLL